MGLSPGLSRLGPGRDDAMNLTKYFMLNLPMDDSFGPTDFVDLVSEDAPASGTL